MATIEVTTLLAAIRQCITVVEPGEVLAVRVAESTTDSELDELTERAGHMRDVVGVRVLFVRGEELARLKALSASGDDEFKALKGEIRHRGGSGPDSVQRALGGGVR